MRIVFAQQLGNNIDDAFKLEPVEEARKWDANGLIRYAFYETDVFDRNIEDRHVGAAFSGDWLCKNDKGQWHCFPDKDYQQLSKSNFEFRMTNKATAKQILAIQTLELMKKQFDEMSYEEKLRLHEEYPDIFVAEKS